MVQECDMLRLQMVKLVNWMYTCRQRVKPTLWTVRGALKSRPPCSRKPQAVLKASRCKRTLISLYGPDILATVEACEEAAYIAMFLPQSLAVRSRRKTAELKSASPSSAQTLSSDPIQPGWERGLLQLAKVPFTLTTPVHYLSTPPLTVEAVPFINASLSCCIHACWKTASEMMYRLFPLSIPLDAKL